MRRGFGAAGALPAVRDFWDRRTGVSATPSCNRSPCGDHSWRRRVDRAQKEKLVTSLQQALSGIACVVVTHQTGMTVQEVTDLRRQMRAAGANFKVTKNRLARRAFAGTKFEQLSPMFTGPTAIAFSRDPVAAAKVAVEFANRNDKLRIIGGGLNEQQLDVAGIKALATLPSLDELRGKILGLLQTPATRIAAVLQAPGGQIARVLAAYAKQAQAG
jgi:large subunit ribosomal protein L10